MSYNPDQSLMTNLFKTHWRNVYLYVGLDGKSHIFMGKDKFLTRGEAAMYVPSFGLRVAYRIKVTMK